MGHWWALELPVETADNKKFNDICTFKMKGVIYGHS